MQVPSKVDAWKLLGQGLSLQQTLHATARDEFGKAGIGPEIIPWIAGPGKEFLQKGFADPVKKQQGVNVLGGMGWVTVEKRADGLYVNGRKVILHVEPGQKHTCEVLGGETLLNAFRHRKPVLHPNLIDALLEYPHLIRDDEKWSKTDDHPLLGPY